MCKRPASQTREPPLIHSLRQRLMERLSGLGIETRDVEHRPVFTVEDSGELYERIPGGHTKNLFLKDAKGQLFLIVAHHGTRIDLKRLPPVIGSGRLSFGAPGLLREVLGVEPGSVTAFALMCDTDNRVRVLIDRNLMDFETINLHPMENTATTSIARDDLLRFIRATGNTPRIAALTLEDAPGES
jgi:Ala-tRNA(Pro) deacylase